MSTAKKPVIVLVPGAWHSPIHFSPMTKLLQGAGYTVAGVDLPSVTWSTRNAPPPDSFDDDVQAVRTVILENAERGEDVLVLSHSYGSLPKMTAVKGLDKKTREAEGKKGGVVHLVFCASFALPEGESRTSLDITIRFPVSCLGLYHITSLSVSQTTSANEQPHFYTHRFHHFTTSAPHS